MNEFKACRFLNDFRIDELRDLPYYQEARDRCMASLIEGNGLCKGEFRFLQWIKFFNKSLPPKISEFEVFMTDSDTPIIRNSTSDDKTFWDNFFQNLKNTGKCGAQENYCYNQ